MLIELDKNIIAPSERNILYWEKDLNSKYRFYNLVFQKVMGLPTSDLNDLTDFDLPFDISKFANTFRDHDQRVIQTGKCMRLLEVQPCSNNEWFILLVTKAPLYNNKNKVIGTSGQAIDLTDLFKKIPDLFFLLQGNNKPKSSNINFSKRQAQILFYLVRGKSSSEIANLLFLSKRTIETHLEILKTKLDCNSKSELIDKCISMGLLTFFPQNLLKTQSSYILEE